MKRRLKDAEKAAPTGKEVEDVRAFHEKFGFLVYDEPGHLTRRKLRERIECLQEEVDEFAAACEAQDLAAQADALVDLVYFAKGTAVMLGLPWGELWDDVQRANMEKARGVGRRGHQADCVKPPGWEGPRTTDILYGAGYQPEDYNKEEDCRDDQDVDEDDDI